MSSSNYTVTILKDQLLNKNEIKIWPSAWNNGISEPSMLLSHQSQGPWPGRPIMPSSLAICSAWLLCQNAVISTALSQSFNLCTTFSVFFTRFLRWLWPFFTWKALKVQQSLCCSCLPEECSLWENISEYIWIREWRLLNMCFSSPPRKYKMIHAIHPQQMRHANWVTNSNEARRVNAHSLIMYKCLFIKPLHVLHPQRKFLPCVPLMEVGTVPLCGVITWHGAELHGENRREKNPKTKQCSQAVAGHSRLMKCVQGEVPNKLLRESHSCFCIVEVTSSRSLTISTTNAWCR